MSLATRNRPCLENRRHQLRPLPHGRPAAHGARASATPRSSASATSSRSGCRRRSQLQHSRRPRLHRLPPVPREDEAGPRHPLPRDRAARRVDGEGRAVRRRTSWSRSRSPPRSRRPIAMIAAVEAAPGKLLAINWPLRWYPGARDRQATDRRRRRSATSSKFTTTTAIAARSGTAPTRSKSPRKSQQRRRRRAGSTRRTHGGGSLLDYLGYGTTLGTWFHERPHADRGHCRRRSSRPAWKSTSTASPSPATHRGLSQDSRRAGARSPIRGRIQPQPKCGFVIVGTRGHDQLLRLRARPSACRRARSPRATTMPVDELQPPIRNPIQYVHRLHRAGKARSKARSRPEIAASASRSWTPPCSARDRSEPVPLVQ